MWTLLLAVFLLAAPFLAAAGPAAPDRAKLERFLRHLHNWPEESVAVKIGPFKPYAIPGLQETNVEIGPKTGKGETARQTFLVSDDGRFVFQGTAMSTDQDPFRETREKIDLRRQASFGTPIPKVVIVEYSDFQCSYCKQFTPVLRQQIPREFGREVRIYFKDFPLVEIHPWAMDAAIAGRCVYRQDPEAFWAFHDWTFEQQSQITPQNVKEKVLGFAGQKKLDTSKLNACMQGAEARAEVDHSLKEGLSLGVSGTPTLFVNGRKMVGSQSFNAVKQVIQTEMDYAKGADCPGCTSTPQATRRPAQQK